MRIPGESIFVRGLLARSFVGVPEEERRSSQQLEIDLVLRPATDFAGMEDDIGRTVDYSRICEQVREICLSRPRCLIESLALDLCEHLLASFNLAGVKVEIRKFVIEDTDCVGVTCQRGNWSSPD